MKTFILLIFGLVGTMAQAQNSLTRVEYFIGDDPGSGSATALTISPGQSLSTNFNIPISTLSDGLHTLHLRTKSNEDKWSLYARKTFYVLSGFQNVTLNAAEYFTGSDPGLGNGTPVSITTGSSIEGAFTIPMDALDEGLHVLKFRVKDAEDKWSLYARRTFLVHGTGMPQNVVAAEYFLGDDPGLGNATELEIIAGNSVQTIFDIELSDLEPYNLYQLHVRVKDSNEKWSLYAKKSFYTVQNPVDLTITAAEYFIDEDPGIGAGNLLDVPSLSSIDEITLIELPASLPDGFHFLHIRVKNENEKWSTYDRHEFESGEGLSTSEQSYDLKIYPNPTRGELILSAENTSVERIRLIDMTGKVLMDKVNPGSSIDLSQHMKGVYLLQIYTTEGVLSRKIVRQ